MLHSLVELNLAAFPVSFGSNCQCWKRFYDRPFQSEEKILQTKRIEITYAQLASILRTSDETKVKQSGIINIDVTVERIH